MIEYVRLFPYCLIGYAIKEKDGHKENDNHAQNGEKKPERMTYDDINDVAKFWWYQIEFYKMHLNIYDIKERVGIHKRELALNQSTYWF